MKPRCLRLKIAGLNNGLEEVLNGVDSGTTYPISCLGFIISCSKGNHDVKGLVPSMVVHSVTTYQYLGMTAR